MNGSMNIHSSTSATGSTITNGFNGDLSLRIQQALGVVHNPSSTNSSRQAASSFLESVKTEEAAPYHGFVLAHDRAQQFVVRHYALSLLEHAVKHRWNEYSESQSETLRGWVLQLSQEVAPQDPLYIRNKTAQLWAEVAKRSWGDAWMDMDTLLVQLWQRPGSLVHKEFVLFVLETLSEDVFAGEDTAAALREGVLNRACIEIFTPAAVLAEALPNRQAFEGIRCGDEGWLVRIGELMKDCLGQDLQNEQAYAVCAAKGLAIYRSALGWIIPAAIINASCVKIFCSSLAAPSVTVQMAAIDALNALYLRPHFEDSEFIALICPMYTTESVTLLRKVFEWSIVDARDIDDEKYSLGKKLSEMLSLLGNFIEQRTSAIPEDCDLPNLLRLFLSVAQSQSFFVSIPILVTWSRLLKSPTIGDSPTVVPLIAPLLELCSSRLVRYESLPEDTDDPCMIFLLEDMDTVPERHAFLGNYRRYSISIIELIVRAKRSDAIYHILSQVAYSLQHLYDGKPSFSFSSYSKTSMPILQVDAKFTVIEAALKGYMKWRTQSAKSKLQIHDEREKMENDFETWCNQLLDMEFLDPIIRKRILQLSVAFATAALDKRSAFMLRTLESILTSQPAPSSEQTNAAYADAVKELQNESLHELTRLATKMPDQLLGVYSELESKVNEILSSNSVDPKQKISYQTFLFIIVLRAVNIPSEQRMQTLQDYVAPVRQLWGNAELNQGIASFEAFCAMLGLNRARDYMVAHQVHKLEDWSTLKLDAEGKSVQAELEERVKSLPLRPTKSFLSCSTERVEKGSKIWDTACSLWQESVPSILPGLLQLLSHSHAFYAPTNWAGLPTEMRPIVGRILTDRFWQAGISEGSKDDFYAHVQTTRTTMEGMASTIRGSVRTVRDACYNILYGLSRLDVHFYGFEELPGPLAHALFADAHCLSSHQLINLLTLVRHMVDDCPVKVRGHFVPPLLATCFAQIDGKMSAEWESLGQKQLASNDDDNLTDEMKGESILRQLTYNAVIMVASLLDPARPHPQVPPSTNKELSTYNPGGHNGANGATAPVQDFPTMRRFCLTSTSILEPLLMFCNHAIRFRDTRCCGVVLRVLRTVIPDFGQSDPSLAPIREFFCTEVLKACITSLHEPYFVDLQRDLAQLIATILIYYSPLTSTPKDVLMSLPGIQEAAVDKCIDYVGRTGVQTKQQRALVLDLLADLKGVSISEQGRITKSVGAVKKERSKMQMEFMKASEAEIPRRGTTPDLEGLAGMFDSGAA